MSVAFIASTDWQQANDEVWTRDSYGSDNCAVLWRGRRTAKQAFENGLKRFGQMPGFSGMRLANWVDVEMTPNFPGIQLNFIGFRDGTIPPVKIVDSNVTSSASSDGTNPTSGQNISGTFLYKASRTTYSWFETTVPSLEPRYNDVTDKTDPLTRIITYSIQDSDTLRPINSVPLADFALLFNKLVRRIFVSDYKREQLIPNFLWACESVVDFQVVQ